MNSLHFLSSPVTDALGWTLLHAIWQGFALVFPTAIILYFLRHQASVLRYRISVLTLVSQLLVSAATFVWYYEPVVVKQPAVSRPIAHYAMQIKWQTVSQNLPWHQQTRQFLEDHLSQFVFIYLIGVVLFGLRLAGGWVYLQQLSKTATLPTVTNWTSITDRLRAALSIKAVIQVRESSRIVVPIVIGVVKPVLLLPIGLATSLSIREIEAVLAHELAHVKRHDYAVNLLQSTVEVLYFFHPALWWLSARVREEREHCCDDLAVQVSGGDGQVLAQALARIEELRLNQLSSTPALAMAFASNRQHLLHRVRRVLGVQTRPFVSNGSLAGLTLATILLMSLSVYAVQKQDKPKPSVSQPKPTRRHKIDKNSEYGIAANHKLSYIIWKGKKLSSTRVTALQRQLDQVMAGQLSLDNIPQPDRDILLTIIEKNYAFDAGMEALSEGMSHIDYNNIVISASTNALLNPDGAIEELTKTNYDSIVENAKTSLSIDVPEIDTAVKPNVAEVRIKQDSLLEQREVNQMRIAELQRITQSQRFAIETIERNIERLERQKSALEQKRFAETTRQQQVIFKSGFSQTDSIRSALDKQIESGEVTIKKTESEIEALNQRLVSIQSELTKAEKPLRDTELQIRKLELSMRQAYVGESWGTSTRTIHGLGRSFQPAAPPVSPTPLRGLTPPTAPIRANARVQVPSPAVAPTPSIKVKSASAPKIKE